MNNGSPLCNSKCIAASPKTFGKVMRVYIGHDFLLGGESRRKVTQTPVVLSLTSVDSRGNIFSC